MLINRISSILINNQSSFINTFCPLMSFKNIDIDWNQKIYINKWLLIEKCLHNLISEILFYHDNIDYIDVLNSLIINFVV